MTDGKPRHEITMKRVLYAIPGMEEIEVRPEVEYHRSEASALTLDLYYPREPRHEAGTPAVVIVAGYPDAGFERFVGCRFKEMGSSVSWAQLIAASGLIAVTYANREPAADLSALLRHIRADAATLGIDASRVGLWASSGNAPLALSAVMQDSDAAVRCVALCYPLTLDLDGLTAVADAAAQFRFVNAAAGKSVADLRSDVPLFLARAGRDEMPGLNAAMDRFAAQALAHNLPITLVNHPAAPHAFDLLHDSAATRAIVQQVLAFLQHSV
jgi:dienelactone hydrolase